MLPQITSQSLSSENNGLHAFIWGAFVPAILQGGMWVNPWSRTVPLAMASSQQQLIRAPGWPSACCLAAFQKLQHSCLSLQIPPKQQAGICIVSATRQINACSLFDPIHIKMPKKRCFFILLFLPCLLWQCPCSLPALPSFSPSLSPTLTTRQLVLWSWKALSPTQSSQELSCQDS